MLKLGSLALDGTLPRVAVGFADAILQADIDDAKADGLDIAEVRIDQFRSYEPHHVIKKLGLFRAIPTIATIRIPEEGGHWKGTETDRQSLLRAIIPHVDAVDIELASTETLSTVGPL